MKLTCLFACLLIAAAASRKSYSGYQVLRTAALNEDTAAKLAPLLRRPEYNFWSQLGFGKHVDIMVSPDHVNGLKHFLTEAGLNPTVHIADVERSVQDEDEAITKIKSIEKRQSRDVTFERYMDFDEIQAYIDEIAAAYPEIVTIIDIGTSYEGRPLRVVKISNGSGKNAILIDATIHAREWISTPVALNVIYELVENYPFNIELVDMIDWYVYPLVNPDGYVYSWTEDRLWTKTRSPNPGSNCMGTDGDRNFDYHWGEGGASSPCEESWPNTKPFSEPETLAFSTFMNDIPNLKMFITLHSYGLHIMYPYGHTFDPAPNFTYMNIYALDAAFALKKVYGTDYSAGQASNVQNNLTYGTGRDWAYGVAGVTYSYSFDLPGGDSGYNPPPEEILPCVIETWEAINYLAFRASTTKRD